MTITALPDPPSRADPTNFRSRADAFLEALPDFATEANALAATVNADKLAAAASVVSATAQVAAATAQAASAAASASAAGSSANFVGSWSSLTGALAVPAACYHAGGWWMLLADVADVAAHTPGVSAAWARLPIGLVWADKSANYTALAGDGIRASTATGSWTLSLPASPAVGDEVGVLDIGHIMTVYPMVIGRNGRLIMGLAEDMTVSDNHAAFTLHYSGATKGWVIR